MTSFNPTYFIHAANILLVVAYSVRDIMWLRLFAVASGLISLPILRPPAHTAVGTHRLDLSASQDSISFNPGASFSNVVRLG